MLSMIIVDDEYIICEGIKTLINWESIGVEVVGTADNGAAALELTLKKQPDIILSDIAMPHFSGLQMIETLRRNGLMTEVIFVSAYSRFDYAKEALRHDAFDYILKPIDEAQLLLTVKRCAEKIRNQRKGAEGNQIEQQQRDKAVATWLKQGKLDAVEAKRLLEVCQISIEPTMRAMGIGLWHEEGVFLSPTLYEGKFGALEVAALPMHEHLTILILCGNPKAFSDVDRAIQALSRLCLEGVLVTGSEPLEITDAFAKMIAQISLGFIRCIALGEKTAVFSDHVGAMRSDLFNAANEREALMDMVKTASKTDNVHREPIARMVYHFFLRMLWDETIFDIDLVRLQCIDLVNYILRDSVVSHLSDYLQSPAKALTAQKSIARCDSIEAVFTATKNLLINLSECVADMHQNTTKRLVLQAVEYIEKNYREDITLTKAAQALYVSPAYLSKIFSIEMQETFSHYLQACRIKKAKERLKSTNDKIYEIAAGVGYSDVAHFSKSFKQFTGISPYQYRNR